MFQIKALPVKSVLDLAAIYVAYIVLGNVSLKLNTVGFYQICKILIGPTVMLLETIQTRKVPKARIVLSVLMLSVGIAIATVSDSQVMSNLLGVAVGLASVLVTALYNMWAGAKQTALQASSSQMVQQFSPYAAGMLALLVPVLEPFGWGEHPGPDTVLGYHFTWPALLVMLLSSVMGLIVALSTFLVIRHTSALTYNVLGHIKTVCIVAGGFFFYNEIMPLKKLIGLLIALSGIVWYSVIKMQESEKPAKETSSAAPAKQSAQGTNGAAPAT